jgi:predicted deacylase
VRTEEIDIEIFNETEHVKRVLADIGDNSDGNTVVFVGGMHGNEYAGVGAILKVFEEVQAAGYEVRGRQLQWPGI